LGQWSHMGVVHFLKLACLFGFFTVIFTATWFSYMLRHDGPHRVYSNFLS
jgi:hypothetical protein